MQVEVFGEPQDRFVCFCIRSRSNGDIVNVDGNNDPDSVPSIDIDGGVRFEAIEAQGTKGIMQSLVPNTSCLL